MNNQPEQYAIKFMQIFNDDIIKCKDSLDYINIVIGVLIFAKLAEAQFRLVGDADQGPERTQESFEMMLTVADSIAKNAVKYVDLTEVGSDIKINTVISEESKPN